MIDILKTQLTDYPDLELLVLIGSRARGAATAQSDWDFALRWVDDGASFMDNLARTETLRVALARLLSVAPEQVDLVQLTGAGLAMRAAVAEEGIPIKGEDSLPWFHFLSRTWRELEDWYWEADHAA